MQPASFPFKTTSQRACTFFWRTPKATSFVRVPPPHPVALAWGESAWGRPFGQPAWRAPQTPGGPVPPVCENGWRCCLINRDRKMPTDYIRNGVLYVTEK